MSTSENTSPSLSGASAEPAGASGADKSAEFAEFAEFTTKSNSALSAFLRDLFEQVKTDQLSEVEKERNLLLSAEALGIDDADVEIALALMSAYHEHRARHEMGMEFSSRYLALSDQVSGEVGDAHSDDTAAQNTQSTENTAQSTENTQSTTEGTEDAELDTVAISVVGSDDDPASADGDDACIDDLDDDDIEDCADYADEEWDGETDDRLDDGDDEEESFSGSPRSSVDGPCTPSMRAMSDTRGHVFGDRYVQAYRNRMLKSSVIMSGGAFLVGVSLTSLLRRRSNR